MGFKYKDEIEKIYFEMEEKYIYKNIEIQEPSVIEESEIIKSLKKPIGMKRLCEELEGHEKISILVSDITRKVPIQKIFDILIEELDKAKIKRDNILVVIALGVHRPNTENEIKNIIGEKWVDKLKIKNHEPFKKNRLQYLGNTKQDTPVWLNEDVYLSDYIIALGKIEPHEFAGFSGGRKSILPGVCGEKTIKINHKPQWVIDKNSKPGSLKNNKIHQDMNEAANMAGLDFIINVVVNKGNEIIGFFSGDPILAHNKGCKFVKEYTSVNIDKKSEIIITSPGSPLNINLYQTVKSIFSLEPILKPNANIIIYSSCSDGMGSEDMLKPFTKSNDINMIYKDLIDNYTIEKDHSLLLTNVLKKNINIYMYSPNIKNKVIEQMKMFPIDSVQKCIDSLLTTSREKEVLIYQSPQRTIPIYTP